MKKYNLALLLLTLMLLFSCDPRVALDYDQWGDKAFITNVQIFGKEVKDDFQMAEYYENGDLTTGIRRVILTGTTLNIDNDAFEVTINIPTGNNLTQAGFLITHTSKLVEPLNGSPKGGVIADLTLGTFKYRLYSADGTVHDWTLNIVEK